MKNVIRGGLLGCALGTVVACLILHDFHGTAFALLAAGLLMNGWPK